MTVPTKQQRAIVDVLDGSAWPALVVLWMALSVAWLMMVREPESVWPLALLVGWLGLTGSSALSGRAGWWWTGLASMALGLVGGAVVGWLTEAAYPASDLAWAPFTAGASLRWQYGGAVVVLGVAVSVAIRSGVQGSGLARAALLSPVAILYLFTGPFPATLDEAPMGLIALTLVVIAIGTADHVAPRIAASRLAHQTAVVTISLAGLLMAAGCVWRYILPRPIDPLFGFGERQVNNVLPIATMAVVAAFTIVIGLRTTAGERRPFDGGHRAHARSGWRALWLHIKHQPLFWIVVGGLLGAMAGRTFARRTFRVVQRQRPDCSFPFIGSFDCEQGLRMVERLDWLFLVAGAAAGLGIALIVRAVFLRHRPSNTQNQRKKRPLSKRRPQS